MAEIISTLNEIKKALIQQLNSLEDQLAHRLRHGLRKWIDQSSEEQDFRQTAATKFLENYTAKAATLDLSGLQLTSLPDSIGLFTHLNLLVLDGNKLTHLPPEIFDLDHQTQIRLEKNSFSNKWKEILSQHITSSCYSGPRF